MDNDKPQQIPEFYDFGAFRLDAAERRLTRGAEPIALTPKEYEVLFYLVARAGRVVEKRDLLDAVWSDSFVEETTLARNVSWLRKKLEDGGEKFIETVPKRGYRFAAAVSVKNSAQTDVVKPSEENIIVVEEQVVRRVQIEDTATISDFRFPISDFEDAQPAVKQLNPKSKIQNPKWFWLAAGSAATIAVLFAFYWFFYRQPTQKIVPVVSVRPFSGLPGREDMPAFSPDGKLLAFVWNRGEENLDLDVYVRQIGAGEPVRLTKNETDDIRPTFSPDGSQIAFVRILPTHNELFLIPALGGAERRVCTLRRGISGVSFAPDGLSIAVADTDDGGKSPGIFTVSVETGAKRRLTEPGINADDRPAFAPDGKSIVFIRSFGPLIQELFVVPTAGGEARQLTFDQAWIGGAAWTPDGQRVVFASLRKYNDQSNVWQTAASGREPPELIAIGGKRLANPAISPNSRTIAFVEESFNTTIRRIEPEAAAPSARARKFAASSFNDNSPNVAPDGARVVFASNRTGNYEIWIADHDGANVRQLTDFKIHNTGSPRFSPDGRWIAFDAQVGGNGDIYIVSADGGVPRRLTEAASFDFMPAWSHDGNFIFFASEREGAKAQIYRIAATGAGEIKLITQNGGRESYAAPDGKYLYYAKGGNNAGLWRASVEGGDEQPVPELAEAAYRRYWTMTKTGIYFVRRADQPPYKIFFYDFAANQIVEKATTDAYPIWVYPGLGVSDDGRSIFYTQSEQNASSIMLAEID